MPSAAPLESPGIGVSGSLVFSTPAGHASSLVWPFPCATGERLSTSIAASARFVKWFFALYRLFIISYLA